MSSGLAFRSRTCLSVGKRCLNRRHQLLSDLRLGTTSQKPDPHRLLGSLSPVDSSGISIGASLKPNPDTKSRTSTALSVSIRHSNRPSSNSQEAASSLNLSRDKLQADSKSEGQKGNKNDPSPSRSPREGSNKKRRRFQKTNSKRDYGATSAVCSTSCSMRTSLSLMTRMPSFTCSSRASHSTRIRNI